MHACWTAVGWRMLIAAIALTRNGATPSSAHDLGAAGDGGSMASAGAESTGAGAEESSSSSEGRAEVLATGENSRGGNSSEADMAVG